MDAGGDGRLVRNDGDVAVADRCHGVRLGVGAAPSRLWTRDNDDQGCERDGAYDGGDDDGK